MPVRLESTEFVVDMERPFELRDYERAWNFDRTIVRFCIEGQPERGTEQFAPLLRAVEAEYGPLLMEGDEVWKSVATVQSVVPKDMVELRPEPDNDAREQGTAILEANGLINFYSICFAFMAEADLIEPVLARLDALEWWGSFWGAGRPYSFLSIAFSGDYPRVEPLLLASITDCSPIFFLSPDHCHLELMAADRQADRLLEIVTATCG